jgi:hypothetical protein
MYMASEVRIMKNKKAIGIHFMIILVIGVIVFFVLAIMIPDLLKKEKSETEGFLDDFDKDGVVDSLDRCVCNKERGGNDGCPSVDNVEEMKKRKLPCEEN